MPRADVPGAGSFGQSQAAPAVASVREESVAEIEAMPAERFMDAEQSARESMPSSRSAAKSAPDDPGATPAAPAAPGAPHNPAPDATAERGAPLLIYTAHLHLSVDSAEQTLAAIERMTREAGGYLLSQTSTTIAVRIPAARFSPSLDAFIKLGDLLDRNVSARDVTEQFRDLETRLDNARAVRERLAALLARAHDVEDALRVERELARVTEQIELMEGQLKRLRELIAFSTIHVRLSARGPERVHANAFTLPFEWLGGLGLPRLLDLE